MTLTDNSKLGQKAAIIHGGKVLILKRSMDANHRPGAWDLPGGNTEWPTTDQSAPNLHRQEIAREVEEEIGLKINPEMFMDQNLIHFMTYFDANEQMYAIICGWRIMPENFDPQSITLSDEHTELAWITMTEVENYDFGEPVGTFVKHIIYRALKD